MMRFLAKIGRFFWSWGFLKFILWTVTLIVLFYVEEDWRGARAWSATKAAWEAKGESFDWNKFIPPPVPDDENLAAIPLFKMDQVEYSPGKFDSQLATLKRVMRSYEGSNQDLPPRGNWMRGELPDMEKIRLAVARDYAAAFKGVTPPQDTLAQFDALYPFLTDLRAASARCSFFRLPEDYAVSPPFSRALGNLTQSIRLSQILTVHAVLALDHHESDLALEDLKVNFKLASGARSDPTLVGALVAMGICAVDDAAIYDGLARHLWTDAQLATLQNELGRFDFLSIYQFTLRSEVVESAANTDYLKKERSDLAGLAMGMSDELGGLPLELEFSIRFASIIPSGWWDQNKCQKTDLVFDFLSTVDPKSQRAFPARVDELGDRIRRLNGRVDTYAPWNFIFIASVATLPTYPPKFAYAQNWVNEARIACALERYRLARNAYPKSLDELAPAYIDALPHDIMNGEPYHYRLQPDGTYLLYSVGWNQTDDGGKIGFEKVNPDLIDYTKGDWVWPTSEQRGP